METKFTTSFSACLAILGKENRNLMVGVYQEIRHGNLIHEKRHRREDDILARTYQY
jgi:hypothetical protein